MFRIKNIRNSTVNKQTNISPSVNVNQPCGIKIVEKVEVSTKTNRQLKQIPEKQINTTNSHKMKGGDHRLKVPENHRRIVLVPQGQKYDDKKKEIQTRARQRANKIQVRKEEESKQKDLFNHQSNLKALKIQLSQICQNSYQQNIQNTQEQKQIILIQTQKQQQPQFQAFIKKQDEYRNHQKENQQLQRIKQQNSQKQQEQKQLQKERKKKQQQQQDRQNEKKHKQFAQKIYARKKAREQQRQRRKKMEEVQQRLRENPVDQNNLSGGIVTLSDPLAHIQMSDALMDAQIAKILRMKFANFPNKQAIQQQIQQLERINTSYQLVRTDPGNPLIRGLSFFRIQLFNRVGQLIMTGQEEIGPSVSGVQIIEANQMNNNVNLIPGARVTRGLEGHIEVLLKKYKLQQQQQCSICLGQIQKGEQIYDVKCKHIFHKKCLDEWLVNTANCPVCRFNIKFDHP